MANYNPCLVIFYHIRPVNGAGLFSEEKIKGEENKKGKYKEEKKEATYKKQNEAGDKGNKHKNNLYNVPPKSMSFWA